MSAALKYRERFFKLKKVGKKLHLPTLNLDLHQVLLQYFAFSLYKRELV